MEPVDMTTNTTEEARIINVVSPPRTTNQVRNEQKKVNSESAISVVSKEKVSDYDCYEVKANETNDICELLEVVEIENDTSKVRSCLVEKVCMPYFVYQYLIHHIFFEPFPHTHKMEIVLIVIHW